MSTAAGAEAERRAAAFLEGEGLRVVDRGWRCPMGELDLVARDGDTVVVVEVKARSRRDYGEPEEAVTAAKRRRLVRAALAYAAARGLTDAPLRFDVVAVGPEGIRHLPDAFRP